VPLPDPNSNPQSDHPPERSRRQPHERIQSPTDSCRFLAPSFASIFHENCIKNGILPLSLQEQEVEGLLAMLENEDGKLVDIDLQACKVTFPDGSVHSFTLDAAQRDCLLQGLDPITLAERYADDIAAFQQRDRQVRPWIWQTDTPLHS